MEEHVMPRSTVSARLRRENGKGPARRLRAQGQVPAVLYGGGKDPVSLSMDPRLLIKALDPSLQRNTLLQVEVEDQTDASCLAMIKDSQVDSLRDVVLHVDLLRVTEDQLVEVAVPLQLTGRAEGVRLGGTIQQVYHDLPVRAPAGQIPAAIVADTTSWLVNYQLRTADLALPPNVSVLLDPKQKIAALIAKVEEAKTVEAVEGEAEAE